ncbi:NRDE family protein [Pedobacter gandavensis]|uniref:NRDE family protein n=1 Tax=Pedobacter gandavensis TaxID=2679963 RepID=UPI00292DCE24|nr:NRDE family protein [Pedobacter gandavensis]
MCTVTYVPTSNGFHLTSNRDEQDSRGLAISPQKYQVKGCELIFPKDPDKGGTWFAQKVNGDVAVLLNGAFISHLKGAAYLKSRGLLLVEILSHDEPDVCLAQTDLKGMEPFTLILFTKGILFEFRWDGSEKHYTLPDPGIPHLWASVTLYTETLRQQREARFLKWYGTVDDLTTDNILDFHSCRGTGDSGHDLRMRCEDRLIATVSMTSVYWTAERSRMVYVDLKDEMENSKQPASSIMLQHQFVQEGFPTLKLAQEEKNKVKFKPGFFGKSALKLKYSLIKILNWEYWPLEVVYMPVLFYWFWLSLKARSLFFFSAANPLMNNAGFAMCRKSSIYGLMPEAYYPKTMLFNATVGVEELYAELEAKGFKFPLIAKPDIGERGIKVQLLKNLFEVKVYAEETKVDFLIQEYIDFQQEAGIFYCRMPGEAKGRITGIVGKEFLGLIGDGISSMEQLLIREDRYFLQLKQLKEIYGKLLDLVLPAGTYYRLLPYGNHSRGAKFTDHSWKLNDDLLHTIDRLCLAIPEFYYGRLDLKFNDWEELCQGRNFSIIEVNGAASEPTHIYDPKHSIFFAWKEIIRHWRLLYQISLLNSQSQGLSLMGTRQGMQMISAHRRYSKLLT